jgi:hypothetical protein
MNFSKLSSLAALGLIAGAMGEAHAACQPPSSSQMSSLFNQLDQDHQHMYSSMNCEGQSLAMQLAMQSCKGKNSCKGMNSCATASNKCAGQGGCKGQSKGPFKDKNQAVEVAKKVMANKRAQTLED